MEASDILEDYDEEDVIILGEVHTENKHSKLEEEAIYRTIPRYVLSEGLNDADPEEFEGMLDNTYLMSLRDIQTYFEEKYEDSQFLANSTRELYEKAQNIEPDEKSVELVEDGRIPDTFNNLMDMPFFRMKDEVREMIQDSIKERAKYENEEWSKWTSEEEPEGLDDDKITTLYKLNPKITEMSFHVTRSQGSLIRPIKHLREEGYDIKLAGCDIDKEKEYSDDSGRNFEQPESASIEELEENPIKAAKDFVKNFEFIDKVASKEEREHRDQVMADRISHFSQRNDSERAIMAVVGANHLKGVVQGLQNLDISVYSEDLRKVARPQDDEIGNFLYAMKTAEQIRK